MEQETQLRKIMRRLGVLTLGLLAALHAQAKLLVKVDEPKTTGNKAVIKLTLKNTFKESVESARATVFLLDERGKVVGQAVQWIIGGTRDKPALAPDATTPYNFVIPTDKPFTRTKVTFNRIILEGGKVVDAARSFEIVPELR